MVWPQYASFLAFTKSNNLRVVPAVFRTQVADANDNDDDYIDTVDVADKWECGWGAAAMLWHAGVLCTQERRISHLELQHHLRQSLSLSLSLSNAWLHVK